MSLVFPGAVVHNAGPEIFQKSACNCGLRFATKVVGGSPSSINENPWIVGLIDRSNFLFCAGTLITDRYIVTAAHCILNKEPFAVRVRLGVSRRDSPNAVEVDVKRLILHSKYNANSYHKFDIGLIEMMVSIDYSDVIFPACLPPHDINLINKVVTVSGWGKNNYTGELEDVLQEVNVRVLSKEKCRNASLYENEQVHKRILCASAPGKDACQGDSGGPMVLQEQQTISLVGVVSWGVGCAAEKYPGIYTSVSGFG
uniref:limulus clotting factor C n=1 Tax=Scylla olivacea TaxID=85551 RepID=A0A0P4X0W2_SCYOL